MSTTSDRSVEPTVSVCADVSTIRGTSRDRLVAATVDATHQVSTAHSTTRWRRRRSRHVSRLETNVPTLQRRRSASLDGTELEEWWSLTPDRLRRIFNEADEDHDGQLPFSLLAPPPGGKLRQGVRAG